jgi:molybdopterin converting factor small subunit
MKVTLKCSGYLRSFFGQGAETVELPENASIQDLLDWIEQHHGSQLPPRLWDFGRHRFRGAAALVIDDETALDYTTPLAENQEVMVIYSVAGG